jgi:large subunit ribosomal protein L17
MLSNLATALFEHGKITTTEAKAKRLRPLAERLVTFAKRGDLAARRRTMTVIRDKGVVHELFTEIAPRYENRPGGYTRITKIGPRKGDNAPMAVIELVEELDESKRKTRAKKPKAKPTPKAEPPPQPEESDAPVAEPESSNAAPPEAESSEAESSEAESSEADEPQAEVTES